MDIQEFGHLLELFRRREFGRRVVKKCQTRIDHDQLGFQRKRAEGDAIPNDRGGTECFVQHGSR